MSFQVKYGHNIPSKDISNVIQLFNIEMSYPTFMDYIEVKFNGEEFICCNEINFTLDNCNGLCFIDSKVLDHETTIHYSHLPNITTFNCMNAYDIPDHLEKIHAETIMADSQMNFCGDIATYRYLEDIMDNIYNKFYGNERNNSLCSDDYNYEYQNKLTEEEIREHEEYLNDLNKKEYDHDMEYYEQEDFELNANEWYESNLRKGIAFPVAKTEEEKKYEFFLKNGLRAKY